MIRLTFRFYVETDTPAGAGCDEVCIDREFSTDDEGHALELAERAWPDLKPARYIDGTLSIA